jgi:hypothetical protein
MAEAYFNTQFSTITNPVRLYWYLQSNPTALVDEYDLPFPNIDGEETLITGLSTKLYRFEFWKIVAGSPTVMIGKPVYLKPKGQKVALELLYYTVGGPETWDPAPDQDTLTDSRLDGKTFYVSQKVNDWRQPNDYAAITGGGFQLLTGEVFEADDQWSVMVVNTLDVEEVYTGGDYQDIKLISASADLDDTYKLKHNIATGSANITTTFVELSTIADTRMRFSTYSFNGNYWTLQLAAGDTVSFLGEDVNYIALRQDCMIELFIEGGVMYVVDYVGKIEEAGEAVLATKKLRGTEYANGQEKDIADYGDLIERLPADMIVSYTDWALTQNVTIGETTITYQKNRAKFAVDTVAGKFKFPDLRDLNFKALKNVDGTSDTTLLSQGAGGLSPQDLLSHGHAVASTGNQSAVNPFRSIQRSATSADPYNFGEGGYPVIEPTGGTKQMIESSNYLPLIRI